MTQTKLCIPSTKTLERSCSAQPLGQTIKWAGLGRTPSLGDRRGFMPPQLKTNKHKLRLHLGVGKWSENS